MTWVYASAIALAMLATVWLVLALNPNNFRRGLPIFLKAGAATAAGAAAMVGAFWLSHL